jgi:hypothetical protein
MAKIRVLSPVGVVHREPVTMPALPSDWKGLSVGFLDNTKSNFDVLARELGALLVKEYGVREIVHRRKANASTPAAPDIVADLAKRCDVVFAGSGD